MKSHNAIKGPEKAYQKGTYDFTEPGLFQTYGNRTLWHILSSYLEQMGFTRLHF